jgi:hypothetical protein
MLPRLVIRAVAALALAGLCTLADARLVVMHGYADYTSALVWIQADAPGDVQVRWRTEHDGREHALTLDAKAADDDVVLARLTGLAPGARATYSIDGDGERREGAVRAQPYWTAGDDAKDVLEAAGRGEGPKDIFVSLGYAGWSAGQLEQELAQIAWLTVEADPDVLFELPAERRLSAAVRLLGIDISRLSDTAGHG